MKAAIILTVPALALAALAPRQLPPLPVNTTCIEQITGATNCLTGIGPTHLLSDLVGWYI